MRILVIDKRPETRRVLTLRVEEALRQAGLKRVEVLSGDLESIALGQDTDTSLIAFIGPGYYSEVSPTITKFRSAYPTVPIALVLDNDVYARTAVELRRELSVRIMPLADIAQMAQYILDHEMKSAESQVAPTQGVISVVQFKGGIGASTLTAALGAVWARHDLNVVIVDLDDVNPQLTDWGRVPSSKRKAVAEMLRVGEVPEFRVKELAALVEGFDGRLSVIPQPERYQESFHYKADLSDDLPSASEFIRSLISGLESQYDVVIVDSGRSWGIATLALLPLSQYVIGVTDDDGMSVKRGLENFVRIYKESDEGEEFDLNRWKWILNAYTGRLLSPKDVSRELESLELFPETTDLFTLPFSERGRQWGGPGTTLYDLAEEPVRAILRDIAFSLVPFRRDASASNGTTGSYTKLKSSFRKLLRSSN